MALEDVFKDICGEYITVRSRLNPSIKLKYDFEGFKQHCIRNDLAILYTEDKMVVYNAYTSTPWQQQ